MGEANASPKCRTIFRRIYEQASAVVRLKSADGEEHLSSPFDVSRGVVQGDIFSPLCFILALQSIFATVDSHMGAGYVIPDGTRPGIAVPTLKYADDAALISALEDEMTARMTAIEEGSLKLADMVIARQKTFYMTASRRL